MAFHYLRDLHGFDLSCMHAGESFVQYRTVVRRAQWYLVPAAWDMSYNIDSRKTQSCSTVLQYIFTVQSYRKGGVIRTVQSYVDHSGTVLFLELLTILA
jgi:hypothetical protein